jgi:hypothetical protein
MSNGKQAFFGDNPFAQHRSALHRPDEPGATVVSIRARRIPDAAEVLRLCQLERAEPELMRKAFG